MTETLEQIALRIAEDIWGSPHAMDVEFAKRLVEALNAQEHVALLPIGAGVTPSIRSTCGVNCVSEKTAKEYDPESILKLYAAPKLGEVK